MARLDWFLSRCSLVVAGLSAMLAPAAVMAQEYPAKSIRWIVPYPPGGTSDVVARLIGQKLTEAWKQPVLVDNRGGANGNIGTEIAAKAPPDGYTLLLVANALTINQGLYSSLTFDAEKDFAPVTAVLAQPNVLAVHPSLPVKSVKEFIALARSKPGALNYASGGAGNNNHLAAELFARMAGIKVTHVPYKGMSLGVAALLTGEVHFSFVTLISVSPYLKSGRLRVLAVTSAERVRSMPDLPTVAEAGVPGYEATSWVGVLVPAKTPRPIVLKLNQEIVRILKTPEVNEQIARSGADVLAGTPEQFAAMIRSDLKRYSELTKAIGIRLE
ncbi:MAG TPA: tripartite tricarboxylate transporter substrate binding protein [Burkholderiales bacterium]|jgi:tripartite-type tricarboxylate transporter receptor subunit TctC|nr:tripartite tricarboxylate transporter substrate binding protein [Burkholderiales bacterium]